MLPRSLADFSGPTRTSGTQTVYQHCPVCGNSKWKLYVDPTTGVYHCFSGPHSGKVDVPGFHMTAEYRSKLLNSLMGVTPTGNERPDWPVVELPEFKLLSREAQLYLYNRGITNPRHIVEVLVGTPRIIVPYYGPSGQIIHWVARAYECNGTLWEPKYLAAPGKKPPYVCSDNFSWGPFLRVVIVEGVFDAIAVHQCTSLPAISIGGTSMSGDIYQTIKSIALERVDILLDNDTAGLRGALKLADIFRSKYETHIMTPRLRDGGDPSSCYDQLWDILKGGEK